MDGWQRITLKTDVSLSRDTEISIKVSEPSGNANGNWYISNCIQSCDANGKNARLATNLIIVFLNLKILMIWNNVFYIPNHLYNLPKTF